MPNDKTKQWRAWFDSIEKLIWDKTIDKYFDVRRVYQEQRERGVSHDEAMRFTKEQHPTAFQGFRYPVLNDVVQRDLEEKRQQGKSYTQALEELQHHYDNSPYSSILSVPLSIFKRVYLPSTVVKKTAPVQQPSTPSVPGSTRFEHTHIVGGSGAGKTTLIQQIILDDLAKSPPPAMVIIDPKGLMVERISHLAVFNKRLKDSLVIIDPTKEPLPALGLFDIPASQRFRNKLVEFFEYIFSTSDAEITQRQSIPFRFVIRLVLSMRGDLNTLMDVLEERVQSASQSRFAQQVAHVSKLDGGAARFFSTDFYSQSFAATREQLRTRLYQIISSPTLMHMFCAPQCRLSFIDALQDRKIILINTGMNDFERKDSQLIGRWAISMTLAAAFSRASIPREQWTPAYLFIDEFQEFADEKKTPELLRLAREYNLGITIAHQNMHCDEFNDSIRGAISTNTSIKYAAAVEGQDLSYVARDLRCEPEFIQGQQRTATAAHFARFVRNVTNHPTSISVPLGNIQSQPQMNSKAHQALLHKNAALLSRIERPIKAPRPEPKPQSSPDEDLTAPVKKW